MKLTRRRALLPMLGVGLLGPSAPRAENALRPTPADFEGPFYPTTLPSDADSDLVRIEGGAREAEGTRLHIVGRVLATDRRPVEGAAVEIWQTDARGNYIHPRGVLSGARDPHFQDYGRARAATDGAYRFRTIMPVAYEGRPPHVHFRIQAPGYRALTTQMYFGGQYRERGLIGQAMTLFSVAERAALSVHPTARADAETGALQAQFDIVLRAVS
jgi:protocatechuate 3,4-dioxygenase beta subunit